MDFSPDDTQRAVADLAQTVIRSADADHARSTAALHSVAGYDEALWKAMAQAGLLSLAVPEALGGEGFGTLAVAAVLAEVGRQTIPVPAFATLSLGVLPLATFGTSAQQSVLAEVADGAVLTAALADVPAEFVGATLVLTGRAPAVPYAAQARLILVPTEQGVALVDPTGPGVTFERCSNSTGTPEYTVVLTGAEVDRAYVLAASVDDLSRFAIAGAAALAGGVLAGALALTAEHLRTRHQFGKPLATFQAVAQQIADVYVVARTVQLASTSVNWRLAEGLDADDDLDIAGYWLAAEMPTALQVCHHLHGGLGVDITYPLHRYYSQGKDLARLVGGSASRLERIGVRCSSN
ncbi:acyl-CoA dehydrogenase family protein [Jatrophihabitans sp.]|uniref:acyl-CoA dehydrogenase family protein n=1 Tax=Jatrophihabitans sp. TaxID=1932789 RepID=UPI0030C683C6|nr:acyl-CoA dehydrogenase [Jatrophihabitans sp.]